MLRSDEGQSRGAATVTAGARLRGRRGGLQLCPGRGQIGKWSRGHIQVMGERGTVWRGAWAQAGTGQGREWKSTATTAAMITIITIVAAPGSCLGFEYQRGPNALLFFRNFLALSHLILRKSL